MSSSSFFEFMHHLKEFVPLIEQKIKETVHSKRFPNFYDGMEYALSSGGKRLRPAMCLLTCKILGGDVESALSVAVAIEIAHNFTLVHDDIEDGDKTRRGKPTVWKTFGTPHAINIGDGMVLKSYESMFNSKLPADKRIDIAEKFTKTLIEVAEGQSMEFNFRERDNVSADEYLEMARKKAGLLFGFSLATGANVANASEQTQSLLHEYGSDIGLAFMIRDDVLNLIGEEKKYGKEIGGDIKEGKRTLMVIDCLSKCNTKEKEKILKILKRPREQVSKDDVKFVIKTMKNYGSIDFAQQYSEDLAKKAKGMLKNLGNDELKKILEELSDFMIKREF